jgi:hypothetical protein
MAVSSLAARAEAGVAEEVGGGGAVREEGARGCRQRVVLRAREVSARPKRCELPQALLREYIYKRLKSAQVLGRHGVLLTWSPRGQVDVVALRSSPPQKEKAWTRGAATHPCAAPSPGAAGAQTLHVSSEQVLQRHPWAGGVA